MVAAKKEPARKVAKKKVAKKKVSKKTSSEQRMEIHEVECALRYKAIEERLKAGSDKFDKLERLVWGIYPLIILLYMVEKIGA